MTECMRVIVLDASAWVDVLAGQGDDALLRHEELAVPPHFDVEVLASVRGLGKAAGVAERLGVQVRLV